MVWFIHDRFGMVCSTTTCSKIKRKWLKVIEAEERGEVMDPEVAQEEVRLEALSTGKKAPKRLAQQQQQQPEQSAQMLVPQASMQMPMSMPMQVPMQMQMQMQLGMPMPYPMLQHEPFDHRLQPHMDHQMQRQLQSKVAHAALHHRHGS
jgi:hypothetical protein